MKGTTTTISVMVSFGTIALIIFGYHFDEKEALNLAYAVIVVRTILIGLGVFGSQTLSPETAKPLMQRGEIAKAWCIGEYFVTAIVMAYIGWIATAVTFILLAMLYQASLKIKLEELAQEAAE